MKHACALMVSIVIILIAGCEVGPNTGKGFSLPEGDVSKGRVAFIELKCNICHSIGDIEQFPSNDQDLPRIKLGGSVSGIKTYGELVTSVINPSHKVWKRYNQGVVMSEDGRSTMHLFNDVMTVTQLVNLVTFLETNYEVEPYRRTAYSRFGLVH